MVFQNYIQEHFLFIVKTPHKAISNINIILPIGIIEIYII